MAKPLVKKTAPAPEPAPEPVDKQKEYLVEKFGNLIKQIGDGYGQPLQEELVNRLEKTISDFHDEVEELIEALKNKSAERQKRLKELWEKGDTEDESPADTDDENIEEPELSEWEKRLERKSAAGSGSSKLQEKDDEEKPKKKGFFGKKK